jgi:CDGSH-type Zn-finger protein
MSNCTCGRTTRKPFCDGSHSLTEAQYKERTQRLAELFASKPITKSDKDE